MSKLPFLTKRPSPEQLVALTEEWFSRGRGNGLLELEKAWISEALGDSFGYYLLQLSVSRELCLFESARVQHKFVCHPMRCDKDRSLLSDFDQLPFASDSLDVVILHHCHEFVGNPQQVLREVERVMVNNGQLVLVGFNPWSLLGVMGRFSRLLPQSMWHNQWLSHRRLLDWLALLGFQVKCQQFGYHRPPTNGAKGRAFVSDNARLNQCLKQLPCGGFYLISAVKQPPAMTPVTPRWSTPRAFPGLTTVKPRVSGGRIRIIEKERS